MSKKGKGIPQFRRPPIKCVYCGQHPATTRDHVIPKSLFTRPLPTNMVTVPVCESCNHHKSLNDDYLRDMLVADVQAAQHPTAQALFRGKVMSAVRKHKSVIAKVAASQARPGNFFTDSGLYVGRFYSVPLVQSRVEQIFSTIVRGLYYQLLKKTLPLDYIFRVRRADAVDTDEVIEIMQQLGMNGPYCLGKEHEFCCVFIYGAEDPGITHWILQFYASITVIVATEPPMSSRTEPEEI